jgi:predicted alpha-1,6-mannanase (GH76 family)
MISFVTFLKDGRVVEVCIEFEGHLPIAVEIYDYNSTELIQEETLSADDINHIYHSAEDERTTTEYKDYVKNKKKPRYNN